MWFKKDGPPVPSLDGVSFDAAGYDPRGEPEPGRTRVWWTPAGDGLGLFLFPLAPDLPRVDSVNALREFYTGRAAPHRIVEVAIVEGGGLPLVMTILKQAQEPSGMTYIGSLTLPFRDFSFVLKVQCVERGTTGMREAVLLARRFAAGDLIGAGGELGLHGRGWNPDSAEFDAEFPDHPVSRLRRIIDQVRGSLRVDPMTARCPRFPLPRR